MAVRRRHIQGLADKILLTQAVRHAPVDVEKVAKTLGVDVHFEPAADNLSGFLLRHKQRAIIGVNTNHAENRQRFTIAHEIGHFLLHDHDEIHIDRNGCGITLRLRDDQSAKGEDDHEREANLFAAELLMPARFIELDVASFLKDEPNLLDDDVLVPLAKKYKVSTQALTFRLANLGYVQI
jgi:Zn-dependent peptidase ImmA (M78 family)